MTEWITAENYRSMLRVFEDLLMCRTRVESFCESSLQVINVNVYVHWRPMTLIVARYAVRPPSVRYFPVRWSICHRKLAAKRSFFPRQRSNCVTQVGDTK